MTRRSIPRWVVPSLCGLVLAAGCAAQASGGPAQQAAAPSAQPAPDCAPVDGAEFLCGVTNIEQLVGVDGTRWAVGSSAAGGSTELAPLYFLNLDTREATPLDPTTVTLAPDTAAYPGCPGPPDFANLQSLGIDHEKVDGRDLLTVISHGGGFTIQRFTMSFTGAVPALTWVGCVLPPDEHFWPDAAATLPDGGMIVTSLYDPVDPDFVDALKSGRPYGSLAEWHADSGWTDIHPGILAGPNGVILSPDHQTLFVANWSGKRVTRIDRRTGETATVDLGMLVDNLAWNADHTKVLAGGQTDTIEEGFTCVGSQDVNCAVHFAVYEVDPTTMEKKPIIGPTVLGVMGGGTGAWQDGDTLWLTSYRSDRIARIPYPS
jgi:hypothetical protein